MRSIKTHRPLATLLTLVACFSVVVTVFSPTSYRAVHFIAHPIAFSHNFCKSEATSLDYAIRASSSMSSSDSVTSIDHYWQAAANSALTSASLDPDALNARWWRSASMTLSYLARDLPHLASFIDAMRSVPDPEALDSTSYGTRMLAAMHQVETAEYNLACQLTPSSAPTQSTSGLTRILTLFARVVAFDYLSYAHFRHLATLPGTVVRTALASSNQPALLSLVRAINPRTVELKSSLWPTTFCYALNQNTPNLSKKYYWLGAMVPCRS